ncbi:MAG: NUDIX hydrolase [Cyclobacteriaceae bacterium]|nr:NUDIX hydrolase [Cyclobacteriaceae bacterium]
MDSIEKIFGGKIRIRVCGLCFNKNKLLLVRHNMNGQPFYAPPGGAVEFGESITDTLVREFKEETCLNIVPGNLLFTTEFIRAPLHAIEMFFSLKSWNGSPCKGDDPELSSQNFIEEVSFFSISDINRFPKSQLHHILHNCNNLRKLLELSGFVHPPGNLNK